MKKELKSSFFYENESVIGTPLTNGEADVTVCVAGSVWITKIPFIESTKNVPGITLVYAATLAPCVIVIVPPLVCNVVN